MPVSRLVRRLAALAAAALAAPALAGDLVIWHAYRAEEKAAMEKVVAAYNAKQGTAGPHVTTLAVPFDAFADKITAAVPRGKGPDLFIYPQDRLGGWIEAGRTVEPLDFYVDAAVKQRFIPTTLQAMTYRQTVYGLPFNFKVLTLIYNKKLVKEPPRATAELASLAKKLTNRAGGTYGLVYDYLNYYYHAALQNGFGGHVFDAATRPVIDSPENVRALDLVMRWREDFLPAEPSSALTTSLFNADRAAMVISGPWFLGEVAKNIDYDLALLPTISEAKDQPMRPWMTVEGLYVTPSCQQKEAAYGFVKYLTDVEAARVMALEGRQTPANQKIYADPAVANDPALRAFYKQVRVAVPMPNVPEMTMMWQPVTAAMGEILRKVATPQAALSKAQATVLKDVLNLRKH